MAQRRAAEMRAFLHEILASDLTDFAVPSSAIVEPGGPFRYLDRTVKNGRVQITAPKRKGRYTLTVTVGGARLIKVIIVVS
jgi:guanyl-specific ribonuclease Sa